jgi:hypothetical protein
MKTCTRCKQLKPKNAFNWKQKHIKRASHCRVCTKEQVKSHYNNNTEYYVKKAKKSNAKIRKKHQEFLATFLKDNPCIDCGENDLLVLELDHREPSKKVNAISLMMRQMVSLKKLEQELDKCDVRCANCHRRKTALEINSWRLMHL